MGEHHSNPTAQAKKNGVDVDAMARMERELAILHAQSQALLNVAGFLMGQLRVGKFETKIQALLDFSEKVKVNLTITDTGIVTIVAQPKSPIVLPG